MLQEKCEGISESIKSSYGFDIPWDMIKDLRKGGALYVNGKVFQKDGKFVGGF